MHFECRQRAPRCSALVISRRRTTTMPSPCGDLLAIGEAHRQAGVGHAHAVRAQRRETHPDVRRVFLTRSAPSSRWSLGLIDVRNRTAAVSGVGVADRPMGEPVRERRALRTSSSRVFCAVPEPTSTSVSASESATISSACAAGLLIRYAWGNAARRLFSSNSRLPASS